MRKCKAQIRIRDFGEKVRYLIGKQGVPELPVLIDEYNVSFPPEFRQFGNEKSFAKLIGIHATTLVHWRNDDRNPHEIRLAPKFKEAERIAQLFGIWPRETDGVDLRTFWLENWPSWFAHEANDQYDKKYKRLNDAKRDKHPDSLAAFRDAYCKELKLYSEDPQKSKLYFPDVDTEDRQRAVEDLVALIFETPRVLRLLREQKSISALPSDFQENTEADENANISASVDWLLNAPIDDVIGAGHGALAKIDKGAPTKELAPIRTALIALTQRIIPALYNDPIIAKLKSAINRESGGLIVLPVYRPAVAEIAVAAAAARSTDYFPRKKKNEWPIGTRSFVDQAPDSGFESQEQNLSNLKFQIANLFSASSVKEVEAAFRSFVADAYFEPEPGTDIKPEARFKLACDNIKFDMDSEGSCFYMTFRHPKKDHERKQLKQLVEKLEKNLQGMLFLALVDDVKIVEDENKRYRPFISMLPVEAAEGQA
ncbi:MAG: hypothetical protein P8Y67_14390 [Alphaproteobacteria bacterium]